MARMPKEYVEGWPEENAIVRTARKTYRCEGSGGVKKAPDCTGQVKPGDRYVEYVGETPAYERGSAHCLPCALFFEFIRPAPTGEV